MGELSSLTGDVGPAFPVVIPVGRAWADFFSEKEGGHMDLDCRSRVLLCPPCFHGGQRVDVCSSMVGGTGCFFVLSLELGITLDQESVWRSLSSMVGSSTPKLEPLAGLDLRTPKRGTQTKGYLLLCFEGLGPDHPHARTWEL